MYWRVLILQNKNKEKTSHLIKQTNQYYTSIEDTSIEDKVHITQVKMVTIETNKQKQSAAIKAYKRFFLSCYKQI